MDFNAVELLKAIAYVQLAQYMIGCLMLGFIFIPKLIYYIKACRDKKHDTRTTNK